VFIHSQEGKLIVHSKLLVKSKVLDIIVVTKVFCY